MKYFLITVWCRENNIITRGDRVADLLFNNSGETKEVQPASQRLEVILYR